MTISSTATRKAGPYSGNGSTVAFAFTFKVFADSDLVVTHTDDNGVETVKTLTTHYTATLNANQNSNPGGTVTMLTAPATGEKVTITSAVPKTQAVNLSDGGGFFASVVNNALDRLTIFSQELAEQVSRIMKLPVSAEAGTDPNLPTPEAGSVLGWNADGDAIINYLPTNGGMPDPGSITATYLANDAVEEEAILDGAVTTSKLGALAVTAAKLAADAVETAKIKDANVTAAKLAADAVTTDKILGGAVTMAKLASALLDEGIGKFQMYYDSHDISVTGSQTITLSFQPRAFVIIAVVDGSSAVSIGLSARPSGGSAVIGCLVNKHADTANTWGYYAGSYGIAMFKSAADYARATVVDSASGLSITWSKNGSPTGTAQLMVLAWR